MRKNLQTTHTIVMFSAVQDFEWEDNRIEIVSMPEKQRHPAASVEALASLLDVCIDERRI